MWPPEIILRCGDLVPDLYGYMIMLSYLLAFNAQQTIIMTSIIIARTMQRVGI